MPPKPPIAERKTEENENTLSPQIAGAYAPMVEPTIIPSIMSDFCDMLFENHIIPHVSERARERPTAPEVKLPLYGDRLSSPATMPDL